MERKQIIEKVRDGLVYFLDTVDSCDLRCLEETGDRLVVLITARREENLSLIMGAIAQERRLLSEWGIDPRDMMVERNAIRINVPLPAAA